MQNNELKNKLYTKHKDFIPRAVVANKNRAKTWHYGYNEKYGVVVISKTGQIGDIINVSGLDIALPPTPKGLSPEPDYWIRHELPKSLHRIQSIFQWNDMPSSFKNEWIDYIETQFDSRENGHWFINKGVPTYITGAHYMYLQWASIDVGYPDFREANRIFYIFWEACKADDRCF